MATTEEIELRGLDRVRLNKDALIAIVTQNRDDHRAIFEEAIENWQKAVTKALEEAVADAKAGTAFRVTFGLVKPVDHTNQYNVAIKMLEMSLDEELELYASDFANYVMDDWGWQKEFLTTSSMYVSSPANKRRIQNKSDIS